MMPHRGARLLASSIDVVLWAIQRRTPITIVDIHDRWGVTKCTAYRWVHDLNNARERAQLMNIPRPPATRAPSCDAAAEVHAP